MKQLFSIFFLTLVTSAVFGQYSGTWKGVFIPAGMKAEDGTVIYMELEQDGTSINGKIRNEGYESEIYAVKMISGNLEEETFQFDERVVLSQKKSHRTKWCRYSGTMKYDSITGYIKGDYNSTDCRRTMGKIILFRSEFEFPEENNITVSQVWFDRFMYDLREGLDAPEIRKIQRDNFVFEPIYFDYDKSEIRVEHFDYLNRMIKVVKGHSDLRVLVTGHTDSDGSDQYNDELSKRRAQAIIDYFVEHGLKADRLQFDFKGEKAPADSNTTPEGRQRNRRVDFKFI